MTIRVGETIITLEINNRAANSDDETDEEIDINVGAVTCESKDISIFSSV